MDRPLARRGDDIAERLLMLGATAVAVARALPKDGAGRHIAMQLIRAGTSGGANYEEARAAESHADFIHKLGIAAKEVRETMFWLKLVRKTGMFDGPLDDALRDTDRLVAILMASIDPHRSDEGGRLAETPLTIPIPVPVPVPVPVLLFSPRLSLPFARHARYRPASTREAPG